MFAIITLCWAQQGSKVVRPTVFELRATPFLYRGKIFQTLEKLYIFPVFTYLTLNRNILTLLNRFLGSIYPRFDYRHPYFGTIILTTPYYNHWNMWKCGKNGKNCQFSAVFSIFLILGVEQEFLDFAESIPGVELVPIWLQIPKFSNFDCDHTLF